MLFTATMYSTDYGFFPRTMGRTVTRSTPWSYSTSACSGLPHSGSADRGVLDDRREGSRRQGADRSFDRSEMGRHRGDRGPSPSLLDEIAHFFEVYKALEPEKGTEISRWEGRAEAERAITEAQARYRPGA